MKKINRINYICKYCGAKFKDLQSSNRIYCSKSCSARDTTIWKNSKMQREMCLRAHKKYLDFAKKAGKIAAKKNKKNNTGLYDSDISSMGWRYQKKHSLGLFNSKIRKDAIKQTQKTLKDNNLSFYNKKIQRKLSLRAHKKYPDLGYKCGLATQIILRQNIRNLKFDGQYYDSKPEIEISMCLQEQFEYIPIEGKTLHVQIGRCEYDFYVDILDIFIEYHPWDRKYSLEEYITLRQLNLINNHINKDIVLIR